MKKITTLILLLVSMWSWTKAQEPIRHEKKVYLSPEGKIYINKSLPVYIRMSTSPDKQEKSYVLKSESTPAYANPMYFDSEGYNTVRSPWAIDTVTKKYAYPKQDIVFEVYADSKSPLTTIHYSTGETFSKDNKIYVNGIVTITLKAEDRISGVENIYYSLDGESFTVCSSALELQEEREYFLKYYSVDHVGNAETPVETYIVLDLSPPQTSCEIAGDRHENIISGRSKILLKAEDKGIGVDKILYKIDDTDWRNYQLPLTTSTMAQGDHTLSYYSTDLTGNREEEKTFDFYVDKTPPVMVQELIGKSFIVGGKEYASGKNQIKLTTFDNKAGVKEVFYSVNNAAYVRYEKPFYLSDVKGNLVLKAYALDNVGNRSESLEKGESFIVPYIDLSGPSLAHSFAGPTFVIRDTVFINTKTGILLKATDGESGVNKIEYAVDESEPVIYNDTFSLEKEGLHKVQVIGYDNVDNSNRIEFVVKLDNTGPVISTQFSIHPIDTKIIEDKNLEVFPGHTVIYLSCSDEKVGSDIIYYSLNGTTEKRYTAPIGNFTADGDYTLRIRALDKLGNETSEEVTFIIEI